MIKVKLNSRLWY